MNRFRYSRTAREGSPSQRLSKGTNWVRLTELARLWGTATFVALDFETTGLDVRADRICEIGAVRISASGEETASFSLLVCPGRPISSGASLVSGITDEMVANARAVDEVLPELIEFLGDSVIVAHNASFDIGFLQAAAERAGLESVENRVADTRDLTKEAFPGLPSYALQKLIRYFELPLERAHRACDDARACARLLALCARSGGRGEASAGGEIPPPREANGGA